MKILIITHSLRYNYGGILQNFALQYVLKQLGHNCLTLKLHRKSSLKDKILSKVKYFVHTLLGHVVIRPLSDEDINLICGNTDLFINQHIAMSPAMGVIDKSWVRKHNFDAIVVGSDQVLHPASYKHIEDIYLGFIQGVKKIIYAGSFGSEKWNYTDVQTHNCARLVKDFSGISVREKRGQQFFHDYFSVKASLVLDPTLLLDQSVYLSTIKQSVRTLGLVTYFLDPSSKKNEIVDFVSKELALPIQSSGNEKMDDAWLSPSQRVAESVENWLARMAGAEFIVTDSFHGTCFAIIFRKPFIAIANKLRGLDRFKTLLAHFGLEDRLIYDFNDLLNSSLLSNSIDYDRVETIQKKKIDESLHFLINNL